MKKVIVDLDLGAAKTERFNNLYPVLDRLVNRDGNLVGSRNGETLELLDFKTQITSPIYRCTGGHNRDINIFFLLAEALWIWTGRKDVAFLEIFNSRMRSFSDNGKFFHAPYGFRLRKWGLSTSDFFTEENKHALVFTDQIEEVINLLSSGEEETRRAVMSIWNPDLDLNKEGKDLPCNDLLMLQERGGKLNITISNRSNDLHWGLPTNVFQFSWILEMITWCLNLEMGTQTHNSKSLHIYIGNDISKKMRNSTSEWDLYEVCEPSRFSCDFSDLNPLNRLEYLDFMSNSIVDTLTKNYLDKSLFVDNFKEKGSYFDTVYSILWIYMSYKLGEKNDENRLEALRSLSKLDKNENCRDYLILAKNWFFNKIKDNSKKIDVVQELLLPEYIGKL